LTSTTTGHTDSVKEEVVQAPNGAATLGARNPHLSSDEQQLPAVGAGRRWARDHLGVFGKCLLQNVLCGVGLLVEHHQVAAASQENAVAAHAFPLFVVIAVVPRSAHFARAPGHERPCRGPERTPREYGPIGGAVLSLCSRSS
jgi:hypothetical protein